MSASGGWKRKYFIEFIVDLLCLLANVYQCDLIRVGKLSSFSHVVVAVVIIVIAYGVSFVAVKGRKTWSCSKAKN